MGIIAILSGMLVPAVMAARRRIKQEATKIEIKGLEAALVLYAHDWGTYPPDKNADMGYGSGECLVYYLRTPFRASNDPLTYCTLNGGPYYEFPGDRLAVGPSGHGSVFMDLLGRAREIHWYQFDNNDDDDADEIDWSAPYDDVWNPGYALRPCDPCSPYWNDVVWGYHNSNFSNVHPMTVDIWSTGWDGKDKVSSENPVHGKIGWSATKEALGDDLGNW
jgi:type II secretory pathway pseudopilin PulG